MCIGGLQYLFRVCGHIGHSGHSGQSGDPGRPDPVQVEISDEHFGQDSERVPEVRDGCGTL